MSAKTVRFMMHLSNALLLVGAIATLAVGACWALKVKIIADFFGRQTELLPNILMVAGGCAAILCILGFYGAAKHSVFLLVVFAIFMILLLIGDLVCVILVYVKISWFDKHLKNDSSTRKIQLYFSAFVGGMGAIEILTFVFAYLLVARIKKIRAEEK